MSRVGEAQDRAARWITAREEASWSAEDQHALDAWLAESDLHRIAYLRLDEGWRQADRMKALGNPELTASDPQPRRIAGWWMPTALAASLVAAVGLGWTTIPHSLNRPATVATARFDTDIGGHRRIGLADGSHIELNTASVVRTAVNVQAREVWLDRGEAFFEVAHDPAHPFVIHAGDRQVTVLGTKFSVRRDGDTVTVAVLEGRVRVDDVAGNNVGRSTTITGGDIAVAQGPAMLVAAKSEQHVEDALAWRDGMLSFDQERLADIAAEFNRYNRQHLVVADTGAGDMRIGGTFPASAPGAFAKLLRDAYGLKIEDDGGTIKISS